MDLISKNPCLIIPDPHGFFLSLTYLSFFFNIYETLFTTQTPRRETYYPCEGLIFKAFNGDYYTFYHNYFIFSKI